ncbi:putative DNA binding domain-containing protein [Dyella jejuensis]|uniref:DNA binding domain-containing protein n=2 Tax=Dyella jejuensis TaxID=1432009 RepID=A0ABW8JQI5_9GAMM
MLASDFEFLKESSEYECKLAGGRDGNGELPKDFWPTYSAMANTAGGIILLGLRELDGKFIAEGIKDVEKVKRELFNNANNKEKVSANLLTNECVAEIDVEGKTILWVNIFKASRKQRPVYLNNRPFGHTYRRLHEADQHCDDETVKRMLAEQVEDERDAQILKGYGLDDIDQDSLRVYRQLLRAEKPDHPFLEHDDQEFLRCLRAWRRDRENGDEGLTVAGLLMFGSWAAIQEAFPHYFVDYQERPEARTENRWVDRIFPDGTWSGNVFDFYRRVYRKLITDLKVPFAVKDGQRLGDSPVHIALREALVNTVVHADYTGRLSILVVKRPDMFGFRNPGGLRLPLSQILTGSESDCRNRIMHQMFLMIGLGERAGSGVPKIFSSWKSQHWAPPNLYEKEEPEQTLLELRMSDLLPADVVEQLRELLGDAFEELDTTGRLILATARMETVVNHARLMKICALHGHDLSLRLANMERDGLLASSGQARAKVYHLPGDIPVSPEDVFAPGPWPLSSGHTTLSSGHKALSSGHSPESSGQSGGSRDQEGCLLSPRLDAPLIDDLAQVSEALRSSLEALAVAPRTNRRISADEMSRTILAVCAERYLTLSTLSKLLDRNGDTLRKVHLAELVKRGALKLAFPATPTHEKQAYRAVHQYDDSEA